MNAFDTSLLLAVNGWHDPYWDQFMFLLSQRFSWALILLVFVWITVRRNWKHALLIVLAVALAVLLADQISSSLIKHLVERLRPTHAPALQGMVHTVNGYEGGLYGFVSSHAANSFAVALLLILMMRHRAVTVTLLIWAALQCYSRVYLGVHYPGDIAGGMAVGLLVGWGVYRLWRHVHLHRLHGSLALYTPWQSRLLAAAVLVTVLIILVIPLL